MLPSIRAVALAALVTLPLNALAVDASVLKPPAGAKIAIVMFQDLEAPECASAFPMVLETADAHKIPVVLYDFPLPRHNWSFPAALWARYFDTQDTKKVKIGNEFRRFIYVNQKQISRDNLHQWVRKFADEHNISVPPAIDSDGKLAQEVKADYMLGQRIGVEHPPTIWVISNSGISQPAVEEITNIQLSQMIDEVLKNAQPASAKSPATKKNAVSRKERN